MIDFTDSPRCEVHDDYYTPKWIIEKLNHLIPKDKVIWEMCLLGSNEQSKKYLKELGHNVIGDNKCDCLKDTQYEKDCDMIWTNPPYQTELKKKILTKISKLDKPFMLIMNSCNLNSKYFQDIFRGKDLYFITPKGKFYFDKYKGKKLLKSHTENKTTSYYSVVVCYKCIDKNHFI